MKNRWWFKCLYEFTHTCTHKQTHWPLEPESGDMSTCCSDAGSGRCHVGQCRFWTEFVIYSSAKQLLLSCCYWQQSHPHTPGNTHIHTHLATLTPTHAWPCSMYIKAHGINNHFKFIHTSLPINLSTSIYTCCYLLFFRRSLTGQIGTEHLTIYLT